MAEATKYDRIVSFLLDNWIIATIVIVATIIAFIPSLRDGFIQIINFFKSILNKTPNDFTIKYQDETITFECKLKSTLFDIVKINAITHTLGVSAEHQWVNNFYPKYKFISQSLSKFQVNESMSLYFDTLILINDKGHKKTIYFDISEFFNDGGTTSSDLYKFAMGKINELYNR